MRDNEAPTATPRGSRRVLIVGDYPPPFGGVSVQVAALRGRLGALPATTVAVLDIGARRVERRAECLPVRGAVDFVAKLIAHATRGFIVHLHTNGHNTKSWLAAAACVAAGLANGRRTVISLGSGLMPEYLTRARAGMRALVRATLRAAGAVIVRNDPARARLLALGAQDAKVRTLSGFYGIGPGDIGRVPTAAVQFVRTHDPVIGAIASPGPEYGIALLIDAAARLRPRHPTLGVLLVGADHVDEAAPSWVFAMDELERASLLAMMRSLDVFVRPTYFDGDASSVREALALGVRVVASDTDHRPEGVTLFRKGDADALAKAIDVALAMPALTLASSSLPALLEIYDALPLDAPAMPSRLVVPRAAGRDHRVA